MPERRLLQVRLTDEARAGLDRFSTRRGITLTALLEALGHQLADDDTWMPLELVARAREIDAERRSRR